jgi:diacylglycerol kinase (ATP)
MASKLCIINPNSGTAQVELVQKAMKDRGISCHITSEAGEATKVVKDRATSQDDLFVVAGGDGTISEVVDGMMQLELRPRLALLPCGTGNDFCRSVGIGVDLKKSFRHVDQPHFRSVDVGEVVTENSSKFFINNSSCGFSGWVDHHLEEAKNENWYGLEYIKSALSALQDAESYRFEVGIDGGKIDVPAYNIIVANGIYAGRGIPVAPEADISDGMLDVVVFAGESVVAQMFNGPSIVSGDHIEADNVFSARGKEVSLAIKNSQSPLNYDGELHPDLVSKVDFKIHASALKVVIDKSADA